MKNKINKNSILVKILGVGLALSLAPNLPAATITLVGNGAGGGPIFVTSALSNINLGTRLRVGTFLDISILNNAISAFKNANQTGTGVSSSQVVFNTTASLAINGASAATYNVFNGGIANVTYSSSIGAAKNLYIWTAFNNEIAIVRNADGTGTANWTTPGSDLSGVTMNLSGLQSSAGGALQTSEILLGTTYDYSSGSDLIALQAAVPEPSSGSLMLVGASLIFAIRKKLAQLKV